MPRILLFTCTVILLNNRIVSFQPSNPLWSRLVPKTPSAISSCFSKRLLEKIPSRYVISNKIGLAKSERDNNIETILPTDVWIRFSPLVGGPRFPPLHVEVILKQIQTLDDNNNANGATTKTVFHRYDFLPMEPKNPETILNLISLGWVPGNVRYRRQCQNKSENAIVANRKDDMSNISDDSIDNDYAIYMNDTESLLEQKLHQYSFRMGIIGDNGDDDDKDVSLLPIKEEKTDMHLRSILERAACFCEDYKKTNSNLHLIENNCYTFAWALIQYLGVKYQIQTSRET